MPRAAAFGSFFPFRIIVGTDRATCMGCCTHVASTICPRPQPARAHKFTLMGDACAHAHVCTRAGACGCTRTGTGTPTPRTHWAHARTRRHAPAPSTHPPARVRSHTLLSLYSRIHAAHAVHACTRACARMHLDHKISCPHRGRRIRGAEGLAARLKYNTTCARMSIRSSKGSDLGRHFSVC